MAYRRKYAKKKPTPRRKMVRYKKRYYKRRPASFTGFGTKHIAKLRYCQEFSLDAPAAGIVSQVFSANGLYDPNISGIGHQPFGFDQLMAHYDHYTVLGSKITVKYMPTTANHSIPGYMGILLSDKGNEAVTKSNVEHLLETKGNTSARYAGTITLSATGKSIRTKTFSAKKFFSKKFLIGSSGYHGLDTSNPLEQAYFEVWVASISANNPGDLTFLATIDYIAVFSERKALAQS